MTVNQTGRHTGQGAQHMAQWQDTGQRPHPVQRFLGGLVRSWQRRRMIRAFEAMDDRLLRDIGLERGDIEDLVESFDDRELRMVPLSPFAAAAGIGPQTCSKAA